MPKLLATIDFSEWGWVGNMNPPHSMAGITASTVIDETDLAYITDEVPTLIVNYNEQDYEVEGTPYYYATERAGTIYGDEMLTEYPFHLYIPSSMNSYISFWIRTRDPGTVTVKIYDKAGGDPLACNWKENIILTPPEEPTGEESEIVTVTVTQNGSTLESDMTLAEIEEAIADGKTVLLKYDASGQGYDDRTYYLNLHVKNAVARFISTSYDRLSLIDITQGGVTYRTYSFVDKIQIQILSGEWTNNTVVKQASYVTTGKAVIVSPDPSYADAYAEAGILCTEQGEGTLTFTCKTVPTSFISVNVVIL